MSKEKISTAERALEGREPEQNDMEKLMEETPGHSFYTAREELREKAYGGKPPGGFQSWGDYWKSY